MFAKTEEASPTRERLSRPARQNVVRNPSCSIRDDSPSTSSDPRTLYVLMVIAPPVMGFRYDMFTADREHGC